MNPHAARRAALGSILAGAGLDGLLLSVGSDLPYLTGYAATPLERLTMAVVGREDPVVLLVPRLEAPRVTPVPGVEVEAWDETDDPVARIAARLVPDGRYGIGDQTWSVFLLALQRRRPDVRFEPATPLLAPLRMRKDAEELDRLAAAAAAADRVAVALRETRFSGRTERDLAHHIAARTVAEGHDAAMFAIVAAGSNGASPHHEPGSRLIAPGDAVVVDFGGRLEGYHSDTTRNFVVGEPPDGYAEAYAALLEAQEAAVVAVRPGVRAGAVDEAARAVLAAAGYAEWFVHRTGHGIGLEVHEPPYIVAGSDVVLREGMTFSIEPGIYLPGRFGMRIEDIVAVTADGVRRLNDSPRSYAVVA